MCELRSDDDHSQHRDRRRGRDDPMKGVPRLHVTPNSHRVAAVIAALVLLGQLGCALPGTGRFGREVRPARVSDGLGDGDAEREASLRLVIQGLEADAMGRPRRARGSYERAVRIDPTNPYAYLALARHQAEGVEPDEALAFLDQAAALFDDEGLRSPGVLVHELGLRGQVYLATGRHDEGMLLLERAREMSPSVWSDGQLSADDLR